MNKPAYQANYPLLFEQSHDAILVTDFRGTLIDVNSGFCQLFGYEKQEIISTNVKTIIEPVHLESNPIRFDLLAAGENLFTHRPMVHKDGRVIHVKANAMRIHDNRIMVIAQDISEKRTLERKLHDQKIQEERKILQTILNTQELERKRMGQILHDNINQILCSVRLYLMMVNDNPSENQHMIGRSMELIDFAIKEVRSLATRKQD